MGRAGPRYTVTRHAAATASPEDPPGFIVATAAQKAAADRGFRDERGVDGPWLRYASTTAPGDIWIAGRPTTGPWWLAVSHPGVAAELGPPASQPGPGAARFAFPTLLGLYGALDRAWHLARSLPTLPLTEFHQQAAGLPRATEIQRLTVQRIGQDVFRRALLDYWGHRCPMTGITDAALLRASHIVPWVACHDDAQRLDVHNGLLLSALWDAAFDTGLVSFANDGTVLTAPTLSPVAKGALAFEKTQQLLGLHPAHRANLWHHRLRSGFKSVET